MSVQEDVYLVKKVYMLDENTFELCVREASVSSNAHGASDMCLKYVYDSSTRIDITETNIFLYSKETVTERLKEFADKKCNSFYTEGDVFTEIRFCGESEAEGGAVGLFRIDVNTSTSKRMRPLFESVTLNCKVKHVSSDAEVHEMRITIQSMQKKLLQMDELIETLYVLCNESIASSNDAHLFEMRKTMESMQEKFLLMEKSMPLSIEKMEEKIIFVREKILLIDKLIAKKESENSEMLEMKKTIESMKKKNIQVDNLIERVNYLESFVESHILRKEKALYEFHDSDVYWLKEMERYTFSENINVDALSSKFEYNIEFSDFGKTCAPRIYYNLKWDGSVYNNITKYQQLRNWFREFSSPNPQRIIEIPHAYSFTYIDRPQGTRAEYQAQVKKFHIIFIKENDPIRGMMRTPPTSNMYKYVLKSKVLNVIGDSDNKGKISLISFYKSPNGGFTDDDTNGTRNPVHLESQYGMAKPHSVYELYSFITGMENPDEKKYCMGVLQSVCYFHDVCNEIFCTGKILLPPKDGYAQFKMHPTDPDFKTKFNLLKHIQNPPSASDRVFFCNLLGFYKTE
jgi:hypothetical protein